MFFPQRTRGLRAGFVRCWGRAFPLLLLAGVVGFSPVMFAAEPVLQCLKREIRARTACSMCHVYPGPELLDKGTWRDEVLPKMKFYLGVDQLDVEKTKNGAQLKASGLFPSTPMIPKEQWPEIERFYLANAPERTNTPSRNELIPVTLKQFVPTFPKQRHDPPLTTAVMINPADGAVLVAEATHQRIDVLNPDGERVSRMELGNIATSIQRTETGFYFGCIGHFFPSEERRGQVILMEETERGLVRRVLASGLPRVAHVEVADLNGDGREDLAVSMFGFLTGRFSWFESVAGSDHREHVLFEKPGAVASKAHDFNGDGAMDLAVLYGQETEALVIYTNDGKGNFEGREVFRRAPTHGHTSFELADFNEDGEMDFLVTNGDNGEFDSPPRSYHGVRIYLAEGAGY